MAQTIAVKDGLKLWSVQIGAFGFILNLVDWVSQSFNYLPQTVTDKIPHGPLVSMIVFGAGVYARHIIQGTKEIDAKEISNGS